MAFTFSCHDGEIAIPFIHHAFPIDIAVTYETFVPCLKYRTLSVSALAHLK